MAGPPRRERTTVRAWTTKDSSELYSIDGWSAGYFAIGAECTVEVQPDGADGRRLDLLRLVEDLEKRGLKPPLLMRFSDILRDRLRRLAGCFDQAIADLAYTGRYRGVFPIKVNQQRHVVEELIDLGKELGFGLEAGSKPELLVALALLDDPDRLIVCNGYKDSEYIETALLARRLGRDTIIVLDRFGELEDVIAATRRLGIEPRLGVRARLATRGAGKWIESTGDKSKFGLTSYELVRVVERLEQEGLLHRLQLLHFHIGSQITAIRAIKDALREASRIYTALYRMGAPLGTIDVGGGLGVDYDGSRTNFHSSKNYSMQEYANDVIDALSVACEADDIPQPDIVSESGRALVAHHALLVFNVLGVSETLRDVPVPARESEEEEPDVVGSLRSVYDDITRKTYQEAFHDALELKEQAISLFNLGYLDLNGRARVEELFWACCRRILKIVRDLSYVPDDIEGIERALADTYYCNFSVFQSVPDHWAVKQLFPVMPIHRLKEKPTRRGIIADLTCDSDGKIDRFIDLHDVKDVVELHPFVPGEPYYLAVFLVGAYQEILGDLHNLFGDTNCVHVRLDDSGYRIDHAVTGDSVAEVLRYVQYDRHDLVERVRQAGERAMREDALSIEDFARLMRHYQAGLDGYTYLEDDEAASQALSRSQAAEKTQAAGNPSTAKRAAGPF
ncbi:MAG: biosynthetic arginine decarboxylase [Myxococcales bacterium]|nr:MAG: biosynthetic arginine decarboxylase [Myxococcales bacterium]